jgi:hypothetical protein
MALNNSRFYKIGIQSNFEISNHDSSRFFSLAPMLCNQVRFHVAYIIDLTVYLCVHN